VQLSLLFGILGERIFDVPTQPYQIAPIKDRFTLFWRGEEKEVRRTVGERETCLIKNLTLF
jgi:hypothetical protein